MQDSKERTALPASATSLDRRLQALFTEVEHILATSPCFAFSCESFSRMPAALLLSHANVQRQMRVVLDVLFTIKAVDAPERSLNSRLASSATWQTKSRGHAGTSSGMASMADQPAVASNPACRKTLHTSSIHHEIEYDSTMESMVAEHLSEIAPRLKALERESRDLRVDYASALSKRVLSRLPPDNPKGSPARRSSLELRQALSELSLNSKSPIKRPLLTPSRSLTPSAQFKEPSMCLSTRPMPTPQRALRHSAIPASRRPVAPATPSSPIKQGSRAAASLVTFKSPAGSGAKPRWK
ncbi:hypothetical protein PYCC9005_004115 [Savitreella phatthalungensis]